MANDKKFDEYAFPVADAGHGSPYQTGMTLRDVFAAHALQGLCADPSSHRLYGSHEEAAETCYQLADAMLEARLK